MKWQRYVNKCKEAAWKRWVHGYLVALLDWHNLSYKKTCENQYWWSGSDTKRQEELWEVEDWIIRNIFMGKDNTIRSIRIQRALLKDQFKCCI